MVAAAVDALNIDQYATDTDVSTAISDALVPYYTAAQVDAEIAANGFDASQYWTRTESDSRYFVQTANAGFTSLIRDNVTPPSRTQEVRQSGCGQRGRLGFLAQHFERRTWAARRSC